MHSVTVKKDDLVAKVKANRKAHRDLFLKAQEGYRKVIVAELDRMLSDAKAGRRISRSINLAEPVDHTADYDRVLAMLEMSVDDTITLNSQEFNQYVRDNWEWSRLANITNTAYSLGSFVPRSGAPAWSDANL
jgi:hypothetical protein